MTSDESKVVLVELSAEDSKELFGWINNREQVLFNSPYRPIHEAAHDAWFEAVRARSDLVIFGVRMASNNQLIGSAQLLNIQSIHRQAELQIRLGNVPARGQGLGTEAVQKLVSFGFVDLNLHRIFLHVFKSNEAAYRVYKKVGFQDEGLLRDAAYVDGEYVDVRVMGLLRADWEERVDRPS
jgi:RimJ/RimL family protein N-acetyltransferase